MDTKLKNKSALVGWLFLFTFGLSGTCLLLFRGSYSAQISTSIYVVCSVAALACSLFILTKTHVFAELPSSIWNKYYNRIPLDIRIVVLVIFALSTLAKLSDTNIVIGYSTLAFHILDYVQRLIVCTLLVTLCLMQLQSLAAQFHNSSDWSSAWEQSIFHRSRCALQDSFLFKSTGIQMTLFMGIIFASGFGFTVVLMRPAAIVIYLPLFLFVTIPALSILVKRLGYLNRIAQYTSNLAIGHATSPLDIRGNSVFAVLAKNINQLREGIHLSQDAEAKSERLKTELITNVSHDLRTPLTSIITYTELLKDEDLSDESRRDYIEIIDRKSQRLKVLIDDLFEASKMASGSVNLDLEKVDVLQLLDQSLAEHDETVQESTLQFRINKPTSPVYAQVDGQKLWRVFDNLIINILKYSLEHTRVYITVEISPDKVTMSFKNVTKYELSQNIDELFERFKRGDTSRHTEGSGLGLAIAKSIVDLHHGSLDLDIEGDLFKATVTLQRA